MVDKMRNDGIVKKQLPYNISDVKSGNFEMISLFDANSFKPPVNYSKPEYLLDNFFKKDINE